MERIRFTPTALTLEEFSKLWSAFFQVEYSLSAVYQASVVLIEDDSTTPQEALPVETRNIYVSTFNQPVITRVMPKTGAGQPILPSSTLVIQGAQLLRDVTTVRVGNMVVTPPVVTETAIIMPVPAGLQAGVLGLQVIQQLLLGAPPVAHPGYESNVMPLVLRPVIVPALATTAQIQVGVTPAVQPGQRVMLMLNQMAAATPLACTFALTPLTTSSTSLTFNITGVQGGGTQYFIRIQVDGAESPLDLTLGSPTFGPTVTIA